MNNTVFCVWANTDAWPDWGEGCPQLVGIYRSLDDIPANQCTSDRRIVECPFGRLEYQPRDDLPGVLREWRKLDEWEIVP